MVLADTLSRSPLTLTEKETDTHTDVECYIAAVINNIPFTQTKKWRASELPLQQMINYRQVIEYIRSDWPEHVSKTPVKVRDFFSVKSELSEYNGMVTRGNHILVPQAQRADILDRIHDGHQGLTKCREGQRLSMVAGDLRDK